MLHVQPLSLKDNVLLWNLRRHGAPLVASGVPGDALPVEETLAEALLLARRRPDVARVWSVVFARNRSGVDLARLRALAEDRRHGRTLGFFLSLVGMFLRDAQLMDQAERLRPDPGLDMEYFFLMPRGARARELAERRTPDLARKWRYWMNTSVASFASCFRKFTGSHAAV